MRTLLCSERAYTVGALMSARMKAWAFLCLSLAKLPQQVACSAGSPAPFRSYRSGFSISPFLLSHISLIAKRLKKRIKELTIRYSIFDFGRFNVGENIQKSNLAGIILYITLQIIYQSVIINYSNIYMLINASA